MSGTHIQLVERYFRRTYFSQDCPFDGHGYAFFFVGECRLVHTSLHRIFRISHRDPDTGKLQHGHVANAVADRDHFFRRYGQFGHQHAQSVSLVDELGNDF